MYVHKNYNGNDFGISFLFLKEKNLSLYSNSNSTCMNFSLFSSSNEYAPVHILPHTCFDIN